MSGLFIFASIGLLFSSLLKIKGVNFALMASIVLMSTPGFVRSGSGQTADVPFSFFMLATMILLLLAGGSTKPNGLTSMAGLTAGFAGWTKNEGQLLIVVSLFALLLDAFHKKSFLRIKFYIAGMLLPGIAIFILKLMSPKGDLFPSSIGQIYSQILDPFRYATILKSLLSGMFFLGEWPVPILLVLLVFVVLSGFKKPASIVLPLILALQLIGYLGVYLITPHDLDWQLGTAFDRNLLQLFPSFLFLLFAYTESPNASHN
jgi:hypothetical protein